MSKKKIYQIKKNNEVVGVIIKPKFPKHSDIVINNNFKKFTNQLANDLIKKIWKIQF